MGVIVAFNYSTWAALFPQFDATTGSNPVTEQMADMYFSLATMVHANDGSGPVSQAVIQSNLLNLLTAHYAALMAPARGSASPAPPSPLVGRISQATEGSVNVSVEMPTNMPMSSAFFSQSQYGLMYWTASAPYRTMRYVPNPANPANAGTGYGPFGWGGGPGWIG